MQFDYCVLFFSGKVAPLDVWPQIICPPESATLSTPQQPYILVNKVISWEKKAHI